MEFDEVLYIPGSITPSNLQEIVFDKFTGNPQMTGMMTFTSSMNEVRGITINSKGVVDY